jgi:SP family arabinose:H+ symporter-like MFS transporter
MTIMKDNSKQVQWTIGFICFAAALGGLLFGFDTAVISGTVDLVKTQFGMDATTEGWFVSSGLLGCIIGVFTAGLISEGLGKKKVLVLAGLLFLLSGLGCALARTADLLVLFRLVGGIGVGVASVIAPMYITEFAPASVRGRMVAFYQLSITIGVLGAYFSNAGIVAFSTKLQSSTPFVEWMFETEVWRGMFLVMIVPSLLFIIMMLLVPESPRWLISKNKPKEALNILNQLHDPDIAQSSFKSIKETSGQHSAAKRSIFVKELRLPLLTGILLCVFQQFSGINAIIYYGPKIFTAAGFDGDNALYAQVIIGVVNVLFTIIAILQADRFGRKPLLVVGLSGMILSLVVVGACFQTGYLDGPLLLIMLLLFIGCFAFSVGPITWILINEIFPNDVRVKAVSICTFALWVAVWMVGQFFPWLLENAGPAAVFWIFAVFSLLNLIFCRKVLVETKGKTLEEIEHIYTSPH